MQNTVVPLSENHRVLGRLQAFLASAPGMPTLENC